MIDDPTLPDIPRLYTALAEWGACVVYVLLARRRPSRLAIWTLALGLPLLIAVQVFAGGLAIALWIPGMVLAAATMYGIIQVSLQRSWQTCLYLTACAFVLAELLASFQWQVRSYFTRDPLGWDVRDVVLLVSCYVIGLAVAFWVERNHFPRELRFEADLRHALTAIAIAAVTVFVSNLSFLTTNSPFSGRESPEIFYIRTLVDLAGFVALFAHLGSRMELQRTHELEAMNSLVRSQHQQYLQTRRTMDEVNSKYHDLKHYIAAIRAELSRAEELVDAVTARLATLRSVRQNPGAKVDEVRFRLRDAQHLAVQRGLTAEWGSVLDSQLSRIDRAVDALTGVHPDYWAYVRDLDAVSTFIAGVVDRMRGRTENA